MESNATVICFLCFFNLRFKGTILLLSRLKTDLKHLQITSWGRHWKEILFAFGCRLPVRAEMNHVHSAKQSGCNSRITDAPRLLTDPNDDLALEAARKSHKAGRLTETD